MDDILWNIPEQKTGTIQLIGGHAGNFAQIIKLAEFLNTLPFKSVRLIFPDKLRSQLPPFPDITYAPATESGSLAKSNELNAALSDADFSLIAGDLSKNSATAIAVATAIKESSRPVLITRDAVDLITPEASTLIERPQTFYLATMVQLQKLLRALLYPKMILLTMPIQQALETLHKFTLSYPCTIITLHEDQVIIAHQGKTKTIPLAKTPYTTISLWSGQLAGQIAALNLWNPDQPLDATLTALTWRP